MGTIRKGVNGGFSGKAGSVIGSSWNGIDYIKGLYKKRTKPFTQEQLEQQAKLQVIGRFLFPLKALMRLGFRQRAQAKQQTGMNVAITENLKNALSGSYPQFAIDYSKVRLSDGGLLRAGSEEIDFDNGLMTIRWEGEVSGISGHPDDEVFILFYHPQEEYFFMPKEPLQRNMQEAVVEVPRRLKSGTVHGWIFLVERNKQDASKTEYLGSVELSE